MLFTTRPADMFGFSHVSPVPLRAPRLMPSKQIWPLEIAEYTENVTILCELHFSLLKALDIGVVTSVYVLVCT